MLYNLLTPFAGEFPLLNLFRYLTFRSGGATLTALLISFVFGPAIIRWLRRRQKFGQPIRDDGPESHLIKQGTPTMGGVMILLAVMGSTLLWADLTNQYVWIVLFVTAGYGLIGFVDDYLKVSKRNHKGLPGKLKLLFQFAIALAASIWIAVVTRQNGMIIPQMALPEAAGLPVGGVDISTHLAVPFFKEFFPDLGLLFFPFAMLVMVGSSNAVNLTDGLDGLAIVPIMIAGACFGLIAYLVGNHVYAGYLQIHEIAGAGELVVFTSALIGASLGFLWFNAPPAAVFMGDTGSLALGGAIGTISVIVKHELVLFIIGGLFVLEAVSVIVQVASFKMTGKRVFRMAPIHHHFEKLGWPEAKVVIRFWIIACILALLGLSTLKLR